MENDDDAKLAEAMRQSTAAIERQVRALKSWWLPLRNGVLFGLGGVIGATLVVSIIVAVVKPLERIAPIAPLLARIANDLEHYKK